MKSVLYRQEGKNSNQSVDADKVLSIEYTRLPKAVDTTLVQFDAALGEGVERLGSAVERLREAMDDLHERLESVLRDAR